MDGTSHGNGEGMNGATDSNGSGHASVHAGTSGLAVADRAHTSVDLTRVGKRIRRLHDKVCGHGQRVEVTRAGCDDVCVLISKRELEAMEAALAYYANTSAHATLCRELAQLLADAGVVHAPRAYAPDEVVRTFADDCAGTASI